jgi:hypothetical protein
MLTVSVLLVAKFDEHWDVIPFASNFVGGQILLAVYLVFMMIMITAAVALAASTRFGQLMTLIICTVVLGLGVIADYAFGQHAAESDLAATAYYTVPNMGPFWVIDGLYAGTEKTTITFGYVGYVTTYAALLVVGILSIAVIAFQRREVG